jgi:F-type H+-transporting ATPase subunit delta
MPAQQTNTTARALARAILELADERRQVEAVQSDLRGLKQAIHDVPALKSFFSSPAVSDADRDRVLDDTLLPRVSPLTGSFLKMLNAKDALGELPDISTAFDQLLDDRSGKIDVQLTVARLLNPGELDHARQRISTAIKKEAIVTQTVDESLIGGMIIRIGDTLMDGSVSAQLKAIERKLVTAR